ncbi:MAG TPA: DUF2203 domain-containing protein [Actinomycetota bacterium]|nr:DUF2203 domain-containing protein [Actinomycetota bacterium]
MAEAERFYTVEEANAALPELRAALGRIREARRTIVRSARHVRSMATTNGGGPEGTEHWGAVRTLRRELEALAARGIVLRDAERGLVDFPARRDGRLVYLCWRPDEEDRVGFWHEVNSGFAGRKPL